MNEEALRERILSREKLAIGGGQTRGGGECAYTEAGVVDYSPDELLITVKTGTPLEELEAILDEREQMLAQEPMDHRVILGTNGVPTIGGAIGVNADGPRRLRYGALREAVLGLHFYDGQGEFIRAGGHVMKNVTGLDITKFFVGSRGSLGIATQASFKLLPQPRERICTSWEMPLAQAMEKLLPVLRMPLEITGAVYSNGELHIRQEGKLLKPLHAEIETLLGTGQAEDEAIWRDFRDWRPLADAPEIWRIFLPPSQAAQMANALDAPIMLLSGGAQILVALPEEALTPHIKSGIYAYCEKGATRGKRLPPHTLGQLELRDKLKSVFDPYGIFEAPDAH